jgi:hypothetical protein
VATLGPASVAPYRLAPGAAGLDLEVDPASRLVPCDVAGEIVGPPVPAGGLALAVAVNGRIVAVAAEAADGRVAFLAPVPDTVLGPGRNPVEVFVVSGAPEAAVLARVESGPAPTF